MKTAGISIKYIRRGLIAALTLFALALLLITGVTRIGTAHANGPIIIQPHTCFDSPNAENCDGADPVLTHCTQNAHTVTEQPVQHNNTPVGFVDLRASDTCHTYWVRSVAYANSGVVSMHATVLVAPSDTIASSATHTENNSIQEADGSLQAYTDMTYLAHPPTSDTFSTFDFADGTSVTVPV